MRLLNRRLSAMKVACPAAHQPKPQVSVPAAHGFSGMGVQLSPLTDSAPLAQLAVSEPLKPEVVVVTTVDWPLVSAGIVNEHAPNSSAVPAHEFGLQDALRPTQVPFARVAEAVPE